MNAAKQRHAENLRQAQEYIARHGRGAAKRASDEEISRAVNDVTYPFGRIGLYQAIRELLDAQEGK